MNGMLESLSTRLQDVFRSLRGQSRLNEASVDAALPVIAINTAPCRLSTGTIASSSSDSPEYDRAINTSSCVTMPKSPLRKKRQPAYTPPTSGKPSAVKIGNPVWLVPTMVTMFILGLLWIVVFYLAGNSVPGMKSLSNLENVLVGFGIISAGFALSTRWR